MDGLYAALLAKEGFTANTDAFEHKQGYLEVFNGAGNYNAAKILESWGAPFDILEPGVTLKPYPCCGSTHAPIDAMIWLRREHGLTPDNVERIESVTHANALMHTDRADPRSELDAKFSVQYCVARALMHGDVKFDDFENEAYNEADVRNLLQRITARPHAHSPKSMDDHYDTEVIVETKDGRTLSRRVEHPLGTRANPAPPERLQAKFLDCASRALRGDAGPRLFERLQQLESVDDLNALSRLMALSRDAEPAARFAA
jgi:2-methylcitrate dehydratase PrpD